jgi:hypothetical protein
MTVANQNHVYGQYMVLDNQIAYGENMVVVGYVACDPPMSSRG